uniref:START domain-containing protein n=1 Tax=Ciona savignyi TaxID=51511 RepID=H2YL05_CIOSA
MTDFEVQAEKLEKEALNIIHDNNGWTYLKTSDQVKVYWKPSPHFKGNMYKFLVEIDEPFNEVYDVMKPPDTTQARLSWDKSIKHYEQLKKVNQDISIGWIQTHPVAMGMISMREFIDLYYFRKYDSDSRNPDYGKTCWIFATSIDYSFHPPTPGCVCAKNYPAGYAVAQDKRNPNKSIMELYVNCDIGGKLPRSLVEAALPSQQVAYVKSVVKEVKHRKGK